MSFFSILFVVLTAGSFVTFFGVMMFGGARQHEEKRRSRGVIVSLVGSIVTLTAAVVILARHIAPEVSFLQWMLG